MSNYNPNIPQPPDRLSNSQGDLLKNFQQADSSFGIDHYKFSDLTSNNGFHNQVTTPLIIGGVHPITTTNPIFYAMKDAGIDLLQYSRGVNNSVPTPLTNMQGAAVGVPLASLGGSIGLVNFTGLTVGLFTVYVGGISNGGPPFIIPVFAFANGFWDGSTSKFRIFPDPANTLTITSTGNTLQLINPTAANMTVFWTVSFHRLQ